MSTDRSESIAVIGAGMMGAGIAEILSRAGHDVAVFDSDADRARAVEKRLSVRAATTAIDAVAEAAFVFEAAAENETTKQHLFREISAATPDAIIASNTSSILPSVLASAVTSPERFVVAHFFNPATVVPLVEIVPAPQTSPQTTAATAALLTAAGKQPVVMKREVAGFVANRLQAALLREAFALERRGVASFADIDLVVRAGLGSRWAAAGPFSIVDLGGLDIWAAVCTRLFPDLANDIEPPAAIIDSVSMGNLGSKSGNGLYPHDADTDAALRERIAEHFAQEFDRSVH